ncbi:hypothetical protein [Kribbella sp. VKM Ac-2500]|uniref:hypothetical protein n=1 Tax=Kribbella sp. VKM Ac-2500 TaxID=2512214 RepID=UPI001305414D|nr:hypothetical protein [Kribbella sp. VKM Ac-2500]
MVLAAGSLAEGDAACRVCAGDPSEYGQCGRHVLVGQFVVDVADEIGDFQKGLGRA